MSTQTIIMESITELPAWIDTHPHKSSIENTSMSHAGESRWDRGLGFDGAMSMARKGGMWEEGASKIMRPHVEMAALKKEGRVAALDTDVAGFMPDVPAMLAGDPCHMFAEGEDEEASKPIISIGVQLYLPYGVNESKLFNRGAAILSVIDDLEDQGYRVELWGCVYGESRTRAKGFGIDLRVKLKDAADYWSPSSVAFGLCHAAFSRRLGFRVVESFEEADNGYLPGHTGQWSEAHPPKGAEFDVWFPYQVGRHGKGYATPEAALKTVTSHIQGVLVTEKAA